MEHRSRLAFPRLTTIVIVLNLTLLLARSSLACNRRQFGKPSDSDIACVCNATSCDSLEFDWPQDDDSEFLLVTSDKFGRRFEKSSLHAGQVSSSQQTGPYDFDIVVNINKRRQQVAGYGGAFTDSATLMLASLPAETRARAYSDYFGAKGLDYNMGRVPIGGTDMSTRPYSYDDLPEGQTDLELNMFKLQPEDVVYKIPAIKLANSIRAERGLEPLKMVAASWSGPAWMKSNQHLVSGQLRSNATGPFWDAYARYAIRFLHEYERFNISMWGLAPQNEPRTPSRLGIERYNFNSVRFSPRQLADYIEDSLVPALETAKVDPNQVRLLLWDDTLDDLEVYLREALAGERTRAYARGLAIHWYSQGLREVPYARLIEANQALPDEYFLISTEASYIGGPKPGNWYRGARYARDILENLRIGSVGWIDWNLALDMSGGPTWCGNRLDSAITVDPHRGEYYKHPMYYALGHVSRFIPARAHVVETQARLASDTASESDLVVAAGELEQPTRRNGELRRRIGLVALNRVATPRRVRLSLDGCTSKESLAPLEVLLQGHSLTSFAFTC